MINTQHFKCIAYFLCHFKLTILKKHTFVTFRIKSFDATVVLLKSSSQIFEMSNLWEL